MPVLILRLSQFQLELEDRPTHCPLCGGENLQRWGPGTKTVQDATKQVSAFYRYHCNTCGHTFRNYPPGVGRPKLTQRIRKLAALCWALGLSAREVVQIFEEFGIELSHMTVWRDGHSFIDEINAFIDQKSENPIEKLCLKNKKRGSGTSLVLDMGNGKVAVLGKINESDPGKVSTWLEPFTRDLDIHISLFGTEVLHNLNNP